jgi:hypothetical protein
MSAVSKVLRVLEDDLLVARSGADIRTVQADSLLERLGANYRPPRLTGRKRFRWTGRIDELPARLRGAVVVTGAASGDRYSVMPRGSVLQCYCRSIGAIEQTLGSRLEEVETFPDLELLETDDPTVYFDSRETETLPFASPVQAWLELQAGDKRQRDSAEVVRAAVLDEAGRSEESTT